jgi:hypothetical protein
MNKNLTSIKLETLKQRNALALEDRKWSYKMQELQYLEAGQHSRSLNQLMWQVPSMVIAITGGLWYGATTVEADDARRVVLIFAAVFNLLTVLIILRLRGLIQEQLDCQSVFDKDKAAFESKDKPKGLRPPKYIVVSCWTVALLVSASVSVLGSLYPASMSKKPAAAQVNQCCNPVVQVVIPEPEPKACDVKPKVKRPAPEKTQPCLP